jgi:transcription elongation factor GreB
LSINYITPLGFKKLQDEYHHLKTIQRPEVTKLVTWAASLGDRSENADYQYGKKKLREIDRRLRFLGKRISEASVVDPLIIKNNQVQFSSSVTTCNEEGEKIVYQIVGVDETSLEKKRISWLSPIGKALIGKRVGDEVCVIVPKGEIYLEILEIKYQQIDIEEYVYEGSSQHKSR